VSSYRLQPSTTQEVTLREHCVHARFVWNLACEQQSWWRPGRANAPDFAERCRQLSEARATFDWLAAGSAIVQQQALRDFKEAMAKFFNRTHKQPSWRKAGRHEGFRIVGVKPAHIRRLSRKVGEVWVSKAGWIRFRWSRAVGRPRRGCRRRPAGRPRPGPRRSAAARAPSAAC
jgi:putative transposase